VSRSLDLDLGAPVFTEASAAPLVLTSADADPERQAAVAVMAEVVVAGETGVEPGRALTELALRGAGIVLCEGGPSLNAQLIAEGVVDEMCLTVAPVLVAGTSKRIAQGRQVADVPQDYDLAHVLEEDGVLFLRYLARRAGRG
jgi:riboflavin biosynthesis pyrimidine reductase